MKQKIISDLRSQRSPQITAIIAILLHALPGRRSVEVDIPYYRHFKGTLDPPAEESKSIWILLDTSFIIAYLYCILLLPSYFSSLLLLLHTLLSSHFDP